MLTIAFVTGTEPGKWFRRYEELSGASLTALASADPFPLLRQVADGAGTGELGAESGAAPAADLALMRLPDPRVGDLYHVVRLYEEAPGVAVPKDSIFAQVGERVRFSDLAGEYVNATYGAGPDAAPGEGHGAEPAAAVDELRGALQVVAANVGVAFAPLPLLRALSKKQVAALEVEGGPGEPTEVALVWLKERDSDEVQEFVGVAKGRTARSSRGGERQQGAQKRGAGSGAAMRRGAAKRVNGAKAKSRNPRRARRPR